MVFGYGILLITFWAGHVGGGNEDVVSADVGVDTNQGKAMHHGTLGYLQLVVLRHAHVHHQSVCAGVLYWPPPLALRPAAGPSRPPLEVAATLPRATAQKLGPVHHFLGVSWPSLLLGSQHQCARCLEVEGTRGSEDTLTTWCFWQMKLMNCVEGEKTVGQTNAFPCSSSTNTTR